MTRPASRALAHAFSCPSPTDPWPSVTKDPEPTTFHLHGDDDDNYLGALVCPHGGSTSQHTVYLNPVAS